MGVPGRAAIKHRVITSLMLVKVTALRRHLTPAREDHTMLGIGFQAKGTVPWPPCPTQQRWCVVPAVCRGGQHRPQPHTVVLTLTAVSCVL